MNQQDANAYATRPIDALDAPQAMSAMLGSHIAALESVEAATEAIEAAASLVATTLTKGGTLHYAAAGSSGLMALADASELPGTFGIPASQICLHMAGGVPVDADMPGDTEDSTEDARRAAASVRASDAVIVVSASGTTPYALAFANAARTNGATIIGVANALGSELLQNSEIAIALSAPPEVVEGSTRLGAGTAQKVVLNMISTRAGILMGHVHDGMMVNLSPDNIKLRQRATGIVSRIAGVSSADAANALEATGYDTKAATLVATGVSPGRARDLLDRNHGRLAACLGELTKRNGQ